MIRKQTSPEELISRKGAKHVLREVEGVAKESRSKLGVLGVLARENRRLFTAKARRGD